MALADDDRVMQYRDFAMTSLAIEAFPSASAPPAPNPRHDDHRSGGPRRRLGVPLLRLGARARPS